MKKTITLGFCFLLLVVQGYAMAQSKYGKITDEELNMTSYPNDTTASAVILLKNGDTRFVYNTQYGFQFEYTLQMKIKILKNDGLDWCSQSISYYVRDTQNKERISGLSGTTYTLEDGKVIKTKLSKEHIVDEDIDDKYKLKKFNMAGAKVGSVIEFKYTLTSDFYYDLRDFYFQESAPIVSTTFEIIIPEYFYYNVNTQGYERIDSKRTDENMSFSVNTETVHCSARKMVFTGENIPALKREPFVWALNDYRSKVSFELQSTRFPGSMVKSYSSKWEDIDKMLNDADRFGGNLKKTGLFKKDIEKGEQTLEKATEIQNMIKERVKWNEKSSFYPDNPGDALKKGLGNSGDMNFLLINALKAAGFNAFPVVLSTRANGILPLTHPSISALNYTIAGVRIDTAYYFTDASAKYGNWNILPEKCMVNYARKIEEGKSSWADLSALPAAMVVKNIQSSFTDSGLLSKFTDISRGNAALSGRIDYHNYKDEGEYIEKLASRLGGEIDDFEALELKNSAVDLKMTYSLKTDNVIGDEFIYINPMIVKHFSESPFKDEERKYPVSFNHLYNYRHISLITIPDGYTVEELPQSEKLTTENDGIALSYRIMKNNNDIVLNYQLKLNKIMFLQDEYPYLRDFFAKLISKNSEQVVLKKIDANSNIAAE